MIFHLKWNRMMLTTQKWGKPITVLKCEHRFYLNWLEQSQCLACKANTLKEFISPSFDLQTLLSLLNSLSASFAPNRNQSIDLLCKSVDWFLYNGKPALKELKYRSSHPEVFLEKVVLKICSKFTGEHPRWSVTSIKLFCKLKSYFGKSISL